MDSVERVRSAGFLLLLGVPVGTIVAIDQMVCPDAVHCLHEADGLQHSAPPQTLATSTSQLTPYT